MRKHKTRIYFQSVNEIWLAYVALQKNFYQKTQSKFSYNFLIKNYFIILHKLAKFHYQAVFTSQVIQ